jgi:hypothetical protein
MKTQKRFEEFDFAKLARFVKKCQTIPDYKLFIEYILLLRQEYLDDLRESTVKGNTTKAAIACGQEKTLIDLEDNIKYILGFSYKVD